MKRLPPPTRRRAAQLLLGLGLLAGALACGELDPALGAERDGGTGLCSEGDSDATRVVTFTEVRAQVFEPRCSCHTIAGGLGQTVGGLDLWSYEALMEGGARAPGLAAVAGDPCGSTLVQKTGTDTVPFGARMPLTGAALDPALRQLIIDWIADGARP